MSATTKARALALAVVAFGLAACVTTKGALDASQVETVRVDGRLLVVRGTIAVNPDPQLESQRLWNVVQPFMQRTCKGPFVVLENNLADKVNLYIRFRCGA